MTFVNKSPSEVHNIVFGPKKYVEQWGKQTDLFPTGPKSPNQATPIVPYGTDPKPLAYAGATTHGNGFFATPRRLGSAHSRAPALVQGDVLDPGHVQVLLLDPRARHERDDRRHAVRLRRSGPRALALAALAGAALVVAGTGALTSIAAGEPAPTGHVREYWVAAVPITWNVVPNGRNAIEGETFTRDKTVFRTVVYRQYTKDFARQVGKQPGNEGIQGPLLHARVGDTILVHFRNLDTLNNQPHSMHFHGVRYQFGSDGSYIPGFSGPGANVKPGETFTYRLVAERESAGVWPYHDHSPSMMPSIEGGLYGALSILGPGERAPDHEFVVYLESHLGFMTIDGRAFVGNTPVFRAKVGDVVQWDVLALGDDFHTFHVHAHRWLTADGPRDTQVIGPAESYKIRWTEDTPGTWLYHCHVESHMMNGMIGIYRVTR